MVEIRREAEDRLSAKIWKFSIYNGNLVLTSYMDGTRATTRHKYRGKAWTSFDERSASLPRPIAIPDDVIDEAISHMTVEICVGWVARKYSIGERGIAAKRRKE